jgi:membrane-bound lytic murein transglycosylase B
MIMGFLVAATSSLIMNQTSTVRMNTIANDLVVAGIPESYIQTMFADPRIVIYPAPVISTSTTPTPPIEFDWKQREKDLLQKASVARGLAWIAANKAAFVKAEKEYGVSKEALTAVMRIETNLGSYVGFTPIFNVFATGVVNDSESRWGSDANNLESLVKYCYQSQIDCLGLKGSYGGAFGYSQFLPYSVMTWGVDGDKDGKVDMFNMADVIPTTANFLKVHGWAKTTASRLKALGRYYGSSKGYPDVTLNYGEALKKK